MRHYMNLYIKEMESYQLSKFKVQKNCFLQLSHQNLSETLQFLRYSGVQHFIRKPTSLTNWKKMIKVEVAILGSTLPHPPQKGYFSQQIFSKVGRFSVTSNITTIFAKLYLMNEKLRKVVKTQKPTLNSKDHFYLKSKSLDMP